MKIPTTARLSRWTSPLGPMLLAGHDAGLLGVWFEQQKHYPDLLIFIEKVLKQDPRPSYKKQRDGEQSYGMTLYNYNIKWTVNGEHNHVTEIHQLPE